MSEQRFTIDQMRESLNKFCNGNYTMSIPAKQNDDDFILAYAIDQLEQAQQENKRLIEALETIKTYTRSTFQSEGNKMLLIEEVATQSLNGVK